MGPSGPLFDAYVMVDWSAAAVPATGADSIWYCCLEREGGLSARMANPPTREAAMAALADLLGDLAARGRRVLAGFDFAFGYPAGFAERVAPREPTWRGVWKALAARIVDAPDNANDRFAAAAVLNAELSGRAFPFWGCPAGQAREALSATRPDGFDIEMNERRLAERRITGPQPVWKLCYPGSVGGQTLLGIPRLLALRHHPWLGDAVRVWPFETGLRRLEAVEPGTVLLAEVYPSLVPPFPDAVKDAGQVRALARRFAGLDDEGRLADRFAGDPGLSESERRIVEAEEGWILGVTGNAAGDWLRDPAAIYRASFAIIRRECDLAAVPDDLREVAVRIVHACGMPDIVGDLHFSPGAGTAGRAALAAGAPIVVDAAMVAHGIIRRLLPCGNEVVCMLDQPSAAARAEAHGTTRSAAAVDLVAERLGGAVLAIGNAPTALFRLLELVAQGAPRPALVLGFPVGFVGAAESKDALAASQLPFVALRGRRGGSAMAAAAVNALAGGLS